MSIELLSIELLDGYTQRIKGYEKDNQRNYIQIAMNLYEVQELEILKDSDYKNIYDYALSEFGFEKTKTVNLISIYKKFFYEEKKAKIGILTYGDYSISQLRYMLNMSDEQIKQCDPKLSVRDIKSIKLNLVARATNEVIDNTDILKNQTVITGVFPDKKQDDKEDENQKTLIVSQLPKSAPKEEIIETSTVITETITLSQNDSFETKPIVDYQTMYMIEFQKNSKMQNELKNINDVNSNYKNILRYIYDKFNSISGIQGNTEVKILKKEIENFIFEKKLPDKLNFMENVI